MSGVRREFAMPDVGEGLTEAEIVTWHVAPGDTVAVNQVLVEIETAKAAVAASSAVRTIGPYATSVAVVPVRTTREENSGSGVAVVSSSAFSQYRRLGSKNITGSSHSMACWIIQ